MAAAASVFAPAVDVAADVAVDVAVATAVAVAAGTAVAVAADPWRNAAADPRLGIDDEMTIYTAAALCTSLQAAFAALPAGATLELDLAGVTDIDSAGVQLLFAARRTAQAQGCGLRLAGHSAAVSDVFRTLDLAGHFGPSDRPLPAPAAAH